MFIVNQTWTWYQPLSAQPVTSIQWNFLLGPTVPQVSSPPCCPFIQSASYPFVCDEHGQTVLPKWGQTAETALPSPINIVGDSPHTYQCWCLKSILPFVCLEMVSTRIVSITFLGIVVRLILIGSNQFWPVLTGCNWIKLVKTSSNQLWLTLTGWNRFQAFQTGTELFQPILTDYGRFKLILNQLEPVGAAQNWSEPVWTGLNQSELVRTSLDWLELVWSFWNQVAPLGTGLNWFYLDRSSLNQLKVVWIVLNWSKLVWNIGDVNLELHGKSSTTLEFSLLSHKMAKNWMCRKVQISPQLPRRSLNPGAEAHWQQRALLTLLLIYREAKCFCFQTPLLKHFLRTKNV